MSLSKINKELQKDRPPLPQNKHLDSVIISDSKGSYIRRYFDTPAELQIMWHCVSGVSYEQLYDWTTANIDHITGGRHTHLHISLLHSLPLLMM